jgi:hypothetical protein
MIGSLNSLQRKTLQEVLDWYLFMVEVLGLEMARVLGQLAQGTVPGGSRFLGLTQAEIEDFFDRHRIELDFLTMLDLMSAAEAAIRLDYKRKVVNRWKGDVSRSFLRIHKNLSKKKLEEYVRLEEDILDTWVDCEPKTKRPVSEFKGAMRLRHWLAYGRYWNLNAGRQQYNPKDVFDISNRLLQAISRIPQ